MHETLHELFCTSLGKIMKRHTCTVLPLIIARVPIFDGGLQLKSSKQLISAHILQENSCNTVLKQQYVLSNFMYSISLIKLCCFK